MSIFRTVFITNECIEVFTRSNRIFHKNDTGPSKHDRSRFVCLIGCCPATTSTLYLIIVVVVETGRAKFFLPKFLIIQPTSKRFWQHWDCF